MHALLCRVDDIVAGWYLTVPVGLAVVAGFGWQLPRLSRRARWAARSLFLLGLLPFLWFLALVLRKNELVGAYSYLLKFSPYLTVFYWLTIVRNRGVSSLATSVKVLAAVLGIRHIAVFLFPGALGEKAPKALYDATFVYGFVGTVPRVFGPGMMLLGLAAILYLGDWTRRRLTIPGYAGLAVAILASATTLTRGVLLVELAGGIGILSVRAWHTKGHLRLTTVVGATAVLLLVGSLLWLAGSNSLENLAPDAGDRLSLDTRTFDWRLAQVDRAFSLSDQWWGNPLFGVGPQTFIRNDANSRVPDTNELHYSFLSVLWTFGAVGLVLLLWPLAVAALLGRRMAFSGGHLTEWYIGLWMFIVQGLYTGTFTEVGSALGVTLCVAAILGSRPHRNSLRLVYAGMPRKAAAGPAGAVSAVR
jgi:hypothetical protein